MTSGLKNQLYSAPPEDVEDPVEVLEKLIASTLRNIKVPYEQETTKDTDEKPNELVKDINFHGLSLQDFVSELHESDLDIERNKERDQRLSYSNKSIEECMSLLLSL